MESKKLIKTSKYLSYILRHKPEAIGLELDENGWALLDDVITKSVEEITLDDIRKVVESCKKQRFAISEDGLKIRANQGHSIKIDLDLDQVIPLGILCHGTAPRFLNKIFTEGLKKMNRHHVHLYAPTDMEKAKNTGSRHQKGSSGVILLIDTEKMVKDGYVFYKTENNVYLTDFVPKEYIKVTADYKIIEEIKKG